ncbi:VOC family protein [Paenibacillus sp. GYB003]|uniref:VOC family protein n=1 Tax=Paenibacillus sp. GYB003 TaxID=2994392 RepID=UPI002F96D6C3
MTKTELQLVGESAVGPWGTFVEAIGPYRSELWNYCRKLTGSSWDGEDLFQDTLLKSFASLSALSHRQQPLQAGGIRGRKCGRNRCRRRFGDRRGARFVSSQNPEEQARFFSSVFGWDVSEPQWGYRTAITGSGDKPGIDGGIAAGPAHFQHGTRLQIQVDSIDESLDKAVENGATVIEAKMDLGAFYLAYFADPVGVQFGLIQYK